MGTLSKNHGRFQFQATSGGKDRILYINCDSICNVSCCLEKNVTLVICWVLVFCLPSKNSYFVGDEAKLLRSWSQAPVVRRLPSVLSDAMLGVQIYFGKLPSEPSAWMP